MRRLLLVDDEPSVVNALKKALRPFRDRWEIETAEGGRAALDVLGQHRFDAVVSDARMPDVDGEAVLEFTRKQHPTTVRLVLSGQVDSKTGHRLASVAHQFLSKPSTGEAILTAVEECCCLGETLADPRVRGLVTSIGKLPVGPRVYHRVSALIDSPTSSAEEVAEVIEQDAALCTSVLRFVSSAFFGLPRAVTNMKQAVAAIGFERVRELVLSSEVFSAPEPLGVMAHLERCGLQRARLARLIAEGSPMTNLVGEAALLSDLGIYALSLRRPDIYAPILSAFRAGEGSLSELEHAAFGCSHAQVAAVLLGLWGLPQTVVNAVNWHHDLPTGSAGLDTRTVLALAVGLEDDARRPAPARTAALEALATQLEVGARLPLFKNFAKQQFGNEVRS